MTTGTNANNNLLLTDQSSSSLVSIQQVNGHRYTFKELGESVRDQSFTLSRSLELNNWIFYHDYIPDFYFSTRQNLHTLKNNSIYKHNSGPRGKFYEVTKKSFFVDLVFNFPESVLLNSVQWITYVTNSLTVYNFKTISHITIWNDFQCSGRIPIKDFKPLQQNGVSKNLAEFSFNDFRDIVKTNGEFMMKSIFQDYLPEPSTLDPNSAWYQQGYFENNYFIIRLEVDNKEDNEVSLHSASINVDKSYR